MPRTVKEWIGKTDNTPVPARVRLRVLKAFGNACGGCGRPLRTGEPFTCDHIKALINGGENRERNLQPLGNRCCLAGKNAADVAEKSATYQMALAAYAIKPARRSRWGRLPGGRDTGIKIKIGGGTRPRLTGAERHRQFQARRAIV